MAKRIFWKECNTASRVPCAPCPFVGKTINTAKDFIEFLQKVLFVPDGGINSEGRPTGKYPCVEFSTKNRNQKLLFAGFGFCFKSIKVRKDGSPFKWCLVDNFEGRTITYYDLREVEDLNAVFDLFEDDAIVQRQIDALSSIVKRDGGLTIKLS